MLDDRYLEDLARFFMSGLYENGVLIDENGDGVRHISVQSFCKKDNTKMYTYLFDFYPNGDYQYSRHERVLF